MRSHADRQPAAQIKFPKLQLVWKPLATQGVKWRLQLFGHHFKGTPRQLIITISIRGFMLWSAGAALTFYLLGTAALAWLWGRNPYNHITYADLALPTHWSELRTKRGQGQIDEGIHELRSGKGATGVMLLSHGLGLRPTDYRGRMVLSQVFLSMGQMHRSLQLLADGLAFGAPPKAYREALFRVANYLEDFESVLKFADEIEKQTKPTDEATRRWLRQQRANAYEKLGRFDEIEKLREDTRKAPSFVIEAVWARAQARRGQPEVALKEIARDPERFGPPADRYQLQLRLAVAARSLPAEREAVRAWQQLEPALSLPRIEEIVALIKLGEDAYAQDRLERFFLHYSTVTPDIVLLFKKLGELPENKWLRRAHQEAMVAGAINIEARIYYVQGLLMTGSVSDALDEFNRIRPTIEQAKINDGGWSKCTQYLMDTILSDSPSNRSQLLGFYRSQRLGPDAYRLAMHSLRRAGSTEMADEIIALARNRFPSFQDDSADWISAKPAVAQPVLIVTLSHRTEAEARIELRRIDEDLQTGLFQSAFNRLKAVEQSGFTALQPELLPRRIQVHGALREQSELSGALQLYLSGPDVSQAWLRQLAQQWAKGPQADSALTVARETYAKFPQARWAAEMLPRSESTSSTPTTVAVTPAQPVHNAGRPAAAPAEAVPAGIRNEAEAQVELRRIDEDLAAGRFAKAQERMTAVERAKIAPLQVELLLRRIQAHGSLNEQTELTAALGYYLSGKTVNQTALRNLATQWDNERQRDSALSLLREIQAKFPQALWAHELRKKIEGDLLIAPDKNLIESEKK